MVRAIQAVSLGVVVFLCCRWLALWLAPLMSENVNLAGQWAFKTLLVAASLVSMGLHPANLGRDGLEATS